MKEHNAIGLKMSAHYLSTMDKTFMVKFTVLGEQIQTEMHNKNVSPQEALGLLEMAQSQILDNLAKGRKEIFESMKRDDI